MEGAAASVARPARGDATRKQIRGSTLLLAGKFITLGANFAVQVMIVRYLSKTDYGAFAYALGVASMGTTLATFGFDRAVTRFVPIYDERGEYDKLFGTLLLAAGGVLSLGLLTIVVAYVASGALISDGQAVSLLLILILLAPLHALDGLLMGMFAVFSKPRQIFFRKHVLTPGLRVAVVLALIATGSGVTFLAFGYVVAVTVGIGIYVVMLVSMLRSEGLLARFSLSNLDFPARAVLGFTIPLLTSDLVYVAMHTSDIVLLGYFGGTDDVAAFRAVFPAAHMNQVVMSSFALLFTPLAARMFARNDEEGINELYWQTAIWIAVFSFPVFALTFSLAGPVTVGLFGARYEDSALILALLALGYYFNAALGFNGLTLKVFGRLRYIVTINTAVAVLNIVVALLLIPRYGAYGAAFATAGTLVLHNFLKQGGLLLGTGVRLWRRRDAFVYATIVGAAGGLLAVQLLLSPPLLVGVALVVLATVGVFAAGRRSLRAAETFPELRKFRFARLLLPK